MSTKIYTGYRISSPVGHPDPFAITASLRPRLLQVHQQMSARLLTGMAVAAIDDATAKGEPTPDRPMVNAFTTEAAAVRRIRMVDSIGPNGHIHWRDHDLVDTERLSETERLMQILQPLTADDILGHLRP